MTTASRQRRTGGVLPSLFALACVVLPVAAFTYSTYGSPTCVINQQTGRADYPMGGAGTCNPLVGSYYLKVVSLTSTSATLEMYTTADCTGAAPYGEWVTPLDGSCVTANAPWGMSSTSGAGAASTAGAAAALLALASAMLASRS
jgi:hypothetical protein